MEVIDVNVRIIGIYLSKIYKLPISIHFITAAGAKLLQLCSTLCNPIDGSPPGFPIPGILQARTLDWVAISFCNAWKWKVKVKLLSHVLHVRLLATPGLQPTRLLCPWDFPSKSTGVGCHCLLRFFSISKCIFIYKHFPHMYLYLLSCF